MNYIPRDDSIPGWIWAIGITAAALTVLGMVLLSLGNSKDAKKKKFSAIGTTFLFVGIFSLLGGEILTLHHWGAANNERRAAVKSQIQSGYGIELSDSEVSSLYYPRSKPTDDFEVFGSVSKKVQTEGMSFSERKIYLVWANGKLGLSQSANGEDFTPLKVKG